MGIFDDYYDRRMNPASKPSPISFGQPGLIDIAPEKRAEINRRYQNLAESLAKDKTMPSAQNWLGVLAHGLAGGAEGYIDNKAEEEKKTNLDQLMKDVQAGNWGGVAAQEPNLGVAAAIKTNPALDSNKTDQQRFIEVAKQIALIPPGQPVPDELKAAARAYDQYGSFARGVAPMKTDNNSIVASSKYEPVFGGVYGGQQPMPSSETQPMAPPPTDQNIGQMPPDLLNDNFNVAADAVDKAQNGGMVQTPTAIPAGAPQPPVGQALDPQSKFSALAQAMTNAPQPTGTGSSRIVYQGEDPASLAGRKAASERTATLRAEMQNTQDKKEVQAYDRASVIPEAKELLKYATGSGAGSMLASGKGFIGVSDKSTQSNAKLKVLGARLVATVPRFEGPQSDKDTQFYKEAAGQIADESTPAADRLAALQSIVALDEKYFGKKSEDSQSSWKLTPEEDAELQQLRARFGK